MTQHTLEPIYREPYVLGGSATITVVGRETRFTYQVQSSDDGKVHFVRVLTAPDLYTFLGTIFQAPDAKRPVLGRWGHGRRSTITSEAQSAQAASWLFGRQKGLLDPNVTVYMQGNCSRCNRPLTTPESIQRGLGPVCAEKMLG